MVQRHVLSLQRTCRIIAFCTHNFSGQSLVVSELKATLLPSGENPRLTVDDRSRGIDSYTLLVRNVDRRTPADIVWKAFEVSLVKHFHSLNTTATALLLRDDDALDESLYSCLF
jgi:hypothetical protein